MHLNELETRKSSGEKIEARPTLVVMPAGLVLQTFQEAFLNFPQLQFHVYYSDAKSTSDVPELSDKVLTQAAFDRKMHQWSKALDDPQTAANVVLSSYSTLHRRCMTKKNVEFDATQYAACPWARDTYIAGLKGADDE